MIYRWYDCRLSTEVVQLSQDEIEPAPSITGSIDSDYLDGVGKLTGTFIT